MLTELFNLSKCGIAGQIGDVYATMVSDDTTAETKLSIAWARLKAREAHIVGFIDGGVTPYGATTLPSLEALQRKGGNTIFTLRELPVKVVFDDGSGVTLRFPKDPNRFPDPHEPALANFDPVKTHPVPRR